MDNIEGIDINEPRGAFGGSDEADSSGVLRYVSIRHGGTLIGADNEINGLTLGAVGSGTTVEFVEVFANLDDGIEFFGGTVNTRYLVVAYCGDDSFDYDQGFRGKGQYWFTIQDADSGDGGEHDGDIDDDTRTPLSPPGDPQRHLHRSGRRFRGPPGAPSTSGTTPALSTTTASSPSSAAGPSTSRTTASSG